MAVGKVTKRAVESVALPPLGKRAHLWDETLKGFGVMVTDKGVRSYLVQYRVGGRGNPTRRVTIGKHGSPWTAERARDRAAELLEQVRRKVDPFDAERERLRIEREARDRDAADRSDNERLRFSRIADLFLEKHADVRQAERTRRETKSIIERDLTPTLGAKLLPAIRPVDVTDLIGAIQERGDSAALKAHRTLSKLFNWAASKHYIPNSPMMNLEPPAKARKRQRALSDAELRAVWIASNGLGWPFGPLVRLLILTGQRLNEVAEMRWTELDIPSAVWTIPGERTKNGEPNVVPLSAGAMAIIAELPKIKSEAGLVFTTSGETAVSGFSRAKLRLDKLALAQLRRDHDEDEAIQFPGWRLHDLRRTLATGCQKLGVRLEVVESILNHTSGSRSGVVGVYQTYRFGPEKRSALEAWERHVTAIVSQAGVSNVVALERRA